MREAERIWVFQDGEAKASRRRSRSIPVHKQPKRKMVRDNLQGHVMTGQGGMSLNGKRVGLD